MILSYICVVAFGQIWMLLHIEANFTFSPLQMTAKSKPSLEPPAIGTTLLQEPSSMDTTPLQEIPIGTTALHETTVEIKSLQETSMGTTAFQGPSPTGTPTSQETPVGTTLQEASKGTPPLKETPMGPPSPMRTAALHETSRVIITSREMATTPLQEIATGSPSQKQTIRSTNNSATHYNVNSISWHTFASKINRLDKDTVKDKSLPTTQLQSETSEDINSAMVQIFAYLVGGILALMFITISVIVIWKCWATRARADIIWAGRSPLTDVEISSEVPITSDKPTYPNKRPSIPTINSLN